MTRLGLISVFSRRLIGYFIKDWIVDDFVLADSDHKIGPILDVEFVWDITPF